MLNKGLGGLASVAVAAVVAAVVAAAVAALQGSQSDSGAKALWMIVGVGTVAAVVGSVGWLLTRNDTQEHFDDRSVLSHADRNSVAAVGNARSDFVSNRNPALGVVSRAGILDAEPFIWWQVGRMAILPRLRSTQARDRSVLQ